MRSIASLVPRPTGRLMTGLMNVVGFGAISYGIAMISVPAGVIAAGVSMLLLGALRDGDVVSRPR